MLAEADGTISAPVYSAVSGTVKAVEPVSYTHLDVYKRQFAYSRQRLCGLYDRPVRAEPVF